jgi:hypothetical protein
MSKFSNLVTQILAILATAPTSDNNTVLAAELRVMLKRAAYTPFEGERGLWEGLGIVLNRYLAPPTSSTWAAQISALVTAA